MFDFINDDERIIFGTFQAIAIAIVMLFVVRNLTRFFLSKRKLDIAEAQTVVIGRADKYDVFISYSHKDEAVGRLLEEELRRSGLRVFLSSSALTGGDNFSEEIKNALRDAGELWIIASPQSLESEWVMTEWGAAWAMGKRVVPLLYNCEPKDLPERLGALHTTSIDKLSVEIKNLKKRLQKLGSKS